MPDKLCDRIHEMISPLLDGELNRRDIRLTLEHICACEACRAYLVKCIKNDTGLAELKECWESAPVPKDFPQMLDEKIMSIEDAKAFGKKIAEDEAVRKRAKEIGFNPEEIIKYAKELELDFDEEERE